MDDIVEDLRATAGDTDAVENASVARLLEKAADEIERLRLTRGERRALEFAVGVYPLDDSIPDTLRGLLERTKTV